MAAVWLRRLFLVALITTACISASAFAATMDYLGAWNSTTTYKTGKVVKHNGGIFYLLKSTWQTVDAVCQGPVLHPAQDCANLGPNKPVIRWMSA
ncbi:MAG: hypothetical protein WCN98_01405 [Verrucomicrobiaceae bacterium]